MFQRTTAFLRRLFTRTSPAATRQRQAMKRRRAFLEGLESRSLLAIDVAVVGSGSTDDSGFAAIVGQLNDDTFFDFNAALVSPTQVDTIAELNAFDVVVIGNNGILPVGSPGGDQFEVFSTVLKSWVLGGGAVVATGWTAYGAGTATGSPVPAIDDIVPVITSGSYSSLFAGTVSISAAHPVTTGVGNFTLPGGGYYLEVPPGPDLSGQVLATSLGSGPSGPAVVVANPGLGNSVYLSVPYASGTAYYGSTASYRSGGPDRLLENAVNWAATSTPFGVASTSFSNSGTLAAGATSLQVTFSANAQIPVLGSQQFPAGSAAQIKAANPGAPSGVYWIDPDGNGAIAPFEVYCDMVTNGGGWMLGVNSVLNSEAFSNDIVSNTGTVSLSSGHTRNLNSYFAGAATAEIRHQIDAGGLGVFQGIYTADSYGGPLGPFTSQSGNTSLLSGSVGAAMMPMPPGFGAPWFYSGSPNTTVPATPDNGNGGPFVVFASQIANSYRIWVRGGAAPTTTLTSGPTAVNNYELRRAGTDGLLGTGDDPIISVAPSYSPNTATLTFPALTEDVYRLTIQDNIFDTSSNRLDGDGQNGAGGVYRQDFVVGAISTTLTSPNSNPFEIEYGEFGAGQLVQGAGGAFDGMGRLLVGGAVLMPNLPMTAAMDVYTGTGVADNSDPAGYQNVSNLNVSFTGDGSPVRLQTSLNVRALNSSGGLLRFRFTVDGIPRPQDSGRWADRGCVHGDGSC